MEMILQKPISARRTEYIGATSAVTVDELKVQSRIDTADEDLLLAQLIAAATDMCELQIQQKVLRQRVRLTFDGFAQARLLLSGLGETAAIESVTYTDMAGVEKTLLPAQYRLVSASATFLQSTDQWPDTNFLDKYVTVIATAGMTTIPAAIKQWILIQAASLYVSRERMGETGMTSLAFVDGLLDPYRLPLV